MRASIYLIEAALLGAFMISASVFTTLIEHPSSPVGATINSPQARRALIGLAMGATAIALIYSPWGRRSGAHFNPAVTLSNWRLGKLAARHAGGYIAAQFVGGATGMLIATAILHPALAHDSVHYVATLPGKHGNAIAWAAEFSMTFVLMTTLLAVNRFRKLAPWSGYFAGGLVALYITFEGPLSGMSMNPARTFASAFAGSIWTGLWIYFTAPVLGMLAAVEIHRRVSRNPHALCCKLSHCPRVPCVIRCNCTAPAAHPTVITAATVTLTSTEEPPHAIVAISQQPL